MGIIEISCAEVWREISSYLDGDISVELRERMQEHFGVCQHCTAVLDGTRNIVQLVGDGRTFRMPEGFGERLYKKIEALRWSGAASVRVTGVNRIGNALVVDSYRVRSSVFEVLGPRRRESRKPSSMAAGPSVLLTKSVCS
jgi:hypothetical protein